MSCSPIALIISLTDRIQKWVRSDFLQQQMCYCRTLTYSNHLLWWTITFYSSVFMPQKYLYLLGNRLCIFTCKIQLKCRRRIYIKLQ